MATEAFRSTNFSPIRLKRIKQAQKILAGYPNQRLTARQVFYQYVARGLIKNTPKNYKLITALLTDARYAGMIDWDIIVDRGREPAAPSEWTDTDGLVETALSAFRLPRLAKQPCYVEVWVEKDALAGILEPIAHEFHVTLMVNKGYSSSSAMHQAARRFIDAHEERGQSSTILYVGDHDPSGEDMVRDITERLAEFTEPFGTPNVVVEKLALTMDQIRRLRPPPNPAKVTDSRATAYIEKFGEQSWELDALPPDELLRIVRRALDGIIDPDATAEVLAAEEVAKKQLLKIIALGKAALTKGKK